MKKIFILISFALLLFTNTIFGQISLSWPIDHSVIQRNSSNSATAWIGGQFISSASNYPSVDFQIQQLNVQTGTVQSTVVNWTTIYSTFGGLYRTSVDLSGGWYQVNVRGTVGSTQVTASAKFGIGDVYFIAGQSNAQGVTSTSLLNLSAYDGVVADQLVESCSMIMPRYPSMRSIQYNYGIGTQGPNSWCYTALGNQLAANTGVPIAFFNGAQFNTSVQNWIDGSNNQPTYYITDNSRNVCATNSSQNASYVGQPYRSFKSVFNYHGGIFGARGIIWHQGEADNQLSTAQTDYYSRFNTLAQTFRNENGNSTLPIWVAQATYNEPVSAFPGHSSPIWLPVQSAQISLQGTGYNRTGVNLDAIANNTNSSSPDHRPDGVHFSGQQLQTLGSNWASSIYNTLSQTTPSTALEFPDVRLNHNPNNTWTLTCLTSASQYFWVDASLDRVDPNYPTGGTITIPANNTGTYVCYIKNAQGNYAVSSKVRIPSSGSGGTRIAAKSFEEEFDLGLTLYPNPADQQTIITFLLPESAQVQLDILDATGSVLKTVVNQQHAAGKFNYPINTTQLPTGLLFCRLKANDLFITKKFIKIGN